MRRFFVALVVFSALTVAGAAPAVAETPGTVQPPCADIIGDAPTYDYATATASGDIRTQAPTCRGFRYTVVVSYAQDGVQKIAAFTHMGGNDIVDDLFGNGEILYSISGIVADNDPQLASTEHPNGIPAVCMAYFSNRGSTLYDAVPDSAATTPPPVQTNGCPGWGLVTSGAPGGGGWYGG
jgi:hypothetical protein